MSSPIGHSLVGLAVYGFQGRPLARPDYEQMFVFIVIANLPDVDFLPGLIAGTPNLYHHGASHSLGAALIVASGLAGLAYIAKKSYPLRNFVLFWGLYMSHVLVDFLCHDGRPPAGVPLLWPFTNAYFTLPILPPIRHAALDHATIGQVLRDIVSTHNLYAVFLEILLALVLTVVFIGFKRLVLKARA